MSYDIGKNSKNRIMYSILNKDVFSLEKSLGNIYKALDFELSRGVPFIHFLVKNGVNSCLQIFEKYWDAGFDKGNLFLVKDKSGTPAIFTLLTELSKSKNSNQYLRLFKKIESSDVFEDIVCVKDKNGNSILHHIASLNDSIGETINIDNIVDILLMKEVSFSNSSEQSPIHFGIAKNGNCENVASVYNALNKKSLIEPCKLDKLGKSISDYAIVNRKHIPFILKSGFFEENLSKDLIHAYVHNVSALLRIKKEVDDALLVNLNNILEKLNDEEIKEFMSVDAVPHPYILRFIFDDNGISKNPVFFNKGSGYKEIISVFSNKDYVKNINVQNVSDTITFIDNNVSLKSFFDNNAINSAEGLLLEIDMGENSVKALKI